MRLPLFLAFVLPALTAEQPADLVLRNGRIWTADPAAPWAQAVAIRGNRIVRVGTNGEVGAGARAIDLGGRLAVPGFNDAHTHFLGGALGLFEVDLVGARSLEEIRKRVKDWAAANPREPWITGAGWEYSAVPGGLPRKEALDAAVPDRPVYLRAYDGHTGWANSKALELAGVSRATKYEGFGEIVRDAAGDPTGCFKEGAQSLVRRKIPAPSRERKLAALERGLKLAATLGITSIRNASGDEETLALFDELARQGKLTLRVAVALSAGRPIPELDALRRKYDRPLLRAAAVKFMLDGVVESHTAALLAPYSDRPETSGRTTYAPDKFKELVAEHDRAGFAILTHAIGDGAVRLALDAYENALAVNGPHDARFSLEHIETVAATDIPRFAKLGVLASMMPIHADPGTAEVWSRAVGPERVGRAFAWRSLERAGAKLVFSSDWPATISVDPIRGLHCAVNRRTVGGLPPGGWVPAERVSLETALRAYTSAAAYASFEEDRKGVVRSGMLADLAVFSHDLFRIDPEKIHEARVVLTVFDGRVIHDLLTAASPAR